MNTTAFIGCAHIHTPGFIKMLKERDDVMVKSVWDHDDARGQKRADEMNARFFGDYRTILDDPEVKSVIICAETNRHEELVLAAAGAKKHMFVEKPLGFAADDARKMADAIEKAGVKFQIGYFMRGNPAYRFLKSEIDKGHFGRINRIRGSNCHAGALKGWFDQEWRWMADPKLAGCGAFGDLGTHSLDIMLWLMGEVTRVSATIDPGNARYGKDCDELGEALMVFKNGATGTLAASWNDIANPVQLQLAGTEGHAVIVNGQLHYQSTQVNDSDIKQPWTQLAPELPHAFNLFFDALAGKDVPLVPVREAAYRSAVMQAMYESACQQKWVDVK
jgi:predicted dehydrogenase